MVSFYFGMVSSRRVTDMSSITTMLGLAREVLMLVRIVTGEDSDHQGGPGPSNLSVDPPKNLDSTPCLPFPVPT